MTEKIALSCPNPDLILAFLDPLPRTNFLGFALEADPEFLLVWSLFEGIFPQNCAPPYSDRRQCRVCFHVKIEKKNFNEK